MSPIGGPGGIGGPKGPGGPTGPSGPDELDEASDVADVGNEASVSSATAAKAAGGLEAMASEIAAGRMTPREAVDKLVDEIAGSDQLGAGEKAELRELLSDLVANDPYLQSLVGRV
jgi:hypothetical protein